jgi:hypothetical protein
MKSIVPIVLVLSLGIWVFFYEIKMRLTPRDTAVVVGFCLAAVLLARWTWRKLRNKPKKQKAVKKAKTLATVLAAHLGGSLLGLASIEVRCQQIPDPAGAEPSNWIACSPDSPVVSYGGSVLLRAWIPGQRPPETSYKWTVTEGSIEGSGSEVRWRLPGVPSGVYRADLSVTMETTNRTCSIRVVVMEPDRGEPKREQAGHFLVPPEPEDPTYGLSSYVLFGSRPTKEDRPRYLGVLQAYLDRINDIAKLGTQISHSKLNMTYLPQESKPPDSADAGWLADHYDYARARLLLDALPGDRRDGIFLVSSLKPLSGSSGPPYLLQDLTVVPTDPPELISWWMREFLNQTSQERFWEPKTGELMALKLRTTISVIAAGLPDVQKSISSWITWIH